MDMRDQYGNRVGRMDAYGNPIQPQQTDAYGNPIHQTAHGVPHQATYGHEVREGIGGKDTAVGHGIGAGHMAGTGGQAQMMRPEGQHRAGGVLRRSGSSSSSSSSEDDGMGGRRKKGLKEKIKEKLPGGQKTDEYGQQQHGYGQATMGATTGYGGTTAAGTPGLHHESEKKGMMEKIKEKLPGGQKTNEYGHQQHGYEQATTGYGGTTTAGTPGVYHEPEKKGMMEKIKEKLPGGQKTDEYGQLQHGYGQATTGYGGTTTTAGTPGVHHELEKKGMMEKIKEKLPCGQNPEEYGQQQHEYGQATTDYGGNTTTAGTTGVHHEPEKKGMMEKIKENLPGHH